MVKAPSIPEWQKPHPPLQEESAPPTPNDQPPTTRDTLQSSPTTELPLLEQARKFLEDESIRNASRERKVAFLQKKGLSADDIDTLLSTEQDSSSPSPTSEFPPELKTVHDNSQELHHRESEAEHDPSTPPNETRPPAEAAPKRDIPPIITYPEFLLKPQKPPPLVTLERLANAAYVFAGVSALTYGASKYIVQPMLEALTEARHELAETTKADLETLNKKLESTVSHVPYFASSSILQKKKDPDDDLDSIDSDPTELFHRDIATQTSPRRSRSASVSSLQDTSAHDPAAAQASRLRSLHGNLSSLLTSTTTHFSQDRLQSQMSQLQGVLDKLETSYNPFQVDYISSLSTDDRNKPKKSASESQASKFKAEIRSFKGALLSSRNFPTARPASPFALPTR